MTASPVLGGFRKVCPLGSALGRYELIHGAEDVMVTFGLEALD